jgi:hypothetical protein
MAGGTEGGPGRAVGARVGARVGLEAALVIRPMRRRDLPAVIELRASWRRLPR